MTGSGTTRTRIALLFAAAGLLAAAAGCAISGPDVATNALGGVAMDGRSAGMDCASPDGFTATDPGLARLPADSVLVAATRCVFQEKPVPGDGEWTFRLEQRADSPLDALTAALKLPSEGQDAQVCDAVGHTPIVITVTDQKGRQLKPALPQDTCGAPLAAAVAAISAVTWTTTAEHKLRQTRSQLEIDSGCPGRYKNVVALVAADLASSGAGDTGQPLGPAQYLPTGPVKVCRYGLDPDPTYSLTVNGSAPVRGGLLTAASTLDGKPAQDLLAAISAAPSVVRGSCDQPPAPFDMITGADGKGGSVEIELGGCYRALVDSDGGHLRQLDAANVAALLG